MNENNEKNKLEDLIEDEYVPKNLNIKDDYESNSIHEKNDTPEEKSAQAVNSDEENQFIIPDSVTFFVSEEDDLEGELKPLVENTDYTAKTELLDIEHFSDYKSESVNNYEYTEPVTEEADYGYDEKTYETYEDITIFENSAPQKIEPIEQKQKYDDPDRERYDSEKPRRVDNRFDFLELFIFTLLAVVLLTNFVFRHSIVEGHSMQNTLQHGEHLIISNLFYTPKRGDIVVCQDRTTGHENPIVKRIIAVEGDTVEIKVNRGVPKDQKERFTVFVNDEPLTEDYVFVDGVVLADGLKEYPGLEKTTVPEGMIFVMGDHRNNSSDSRDLRDGTPTFIREDSILGKAVLRFYPFSEFGRLN